jgi:hypothetical protein
MAGTGCLVVGAELTWRTEAACVQSGADLQAGIFVGAPKVRRISRSEEGFRGRMNGMSPNPKIQVPANLRE